MPAFANALMILVALGNGVILLTASLPMALGIVRPNRFYGFRTRKTLSDERIWYAANKVMGRDMVIAGAVSLLAATLAATVRTVDHIPSGPLALGVTAVSLVASLVHGLWALRRM